MSHFEDRPRIFVSLDRHWIYRLGLDWLTYQRLIRRAGGVPRTIYYHSDTGIIDSMNLDLYSGQSFDGLLLGGGVDVDPNHYRSNIEPHLPRRRIRRQRDEFELQLIHQSITVGRPVLGICRGCQLLNVALGGSLRILGKNRLHRHAARCWKHPVGIRRNSQLHQILATTRLAEVRSIHSEVVDKPGRGVKIVARSPDGIPEAIEAHGENISSGFCLGVQWHPELIAWRNPDQPLINAFIEAAREFQKTRREMASAGYPR